MCKRCCCCQFENFTIKKSFGSPDNKLEIFPIPSWQDEGFQTDIRLFFPSQNVNRTLYTQSDHFLLSFNLFTLLTTEPLQFHSNVKRCILIRKQKDTKKEFLIRIFLQTKSFAFRRSRYFLVQFTQRKNPNSPWFNKYTTVNFPK